MIAGRREREREEGRERKGGKKNSVIYFTSAVSSIAAIKFDGTEFRNAVLEVFERDCIYTIHIHV